jgi:dipeptidyl aminopeptidase/acylaminoacyl peptidase
VWTSADGTGEIEPLLKRERAFPHSWSPDGQVLAYYELTPDGRDIWMLPLNGDPSPFLVTPANERSPAFSPDGRWIAYVSDESGRDEVYVQPYAGLGGEWTISTDGGREPVWSRDGKELFYRNGQQMMVVDVELEPTFGASEPRMLFVESYEMHFGGSGSQFYDVARDGQHFVMVRAEQEAVPSQLHVVVNWFEELKGLVEGR